MGRCAHTHIHPCVFLSGIPATLKKRNAQRLIDISCRMLRFRPEDLSMHQFSCFFPTPFLGIASDPNFYRFYEKLKIHFRSSQNKNVIPASTLNHCLLIHRVWRNFRFNLQQKYVALRNSPKMWCKRS